ncbi:MAG: hypothetical protein NC331_04940 [Lachnospiraceae bacterium]|nr:hypothetical protein [Lachnospiraceae bacterium]MCM1238711.1 hypothetical protein [Lachnospiraceae bacterium]
MKRKSLSKVFALALASAMTLGLAACGGGDDGAAGSSQASTAGSSQASTAGSSQASTGGDSASTPIARQTITWSVIDLNAGNNNVGDYAEQIFQQIEDYVGHDIDITWVMNDALSETNSLAFASPKTMPMIMSYGGTMTGDVVRAAKDGAFVDLNEYIWDAEKYPNLAGMSPAVAANLTVDGKLIALPRTRVVGRYGLCYRQDWAEALGVELSENATPEDVYNMLVAMKNGNDKHEGFCTYPMEMTSYTGPFDIIQTWFGCGNAWADVDGQLVPVWMQDEYFEAVEYIKKLYDEELMPQDWPSRGTDTWSDGCKKGDNGVYIDVLDSGKRIWNYFVAEETYTPSVVNPDESASMVLYGAVNGHTLATAGYNGFFTLSASTLDTPEKIEAALTILDKLSDPEMQVLTQFGLEGINYERDDQGRVVKLDAEDEKLAGNYKGLNQLLTFLPSTEATTVPVVTTERDDAQNAAYAAALPLAEVDPALSFKVNSESYSLNGADLDTQATALRSQYICGEITLDQFKSGLDGIRAAGYDQIIAEINEQYAANK